MPLVLAKEDIEASVIRMGGKEEVRRHLGNMRFTPEAGVIVASANNGDMIANIKESRVVIGREMANKIMV